MKRGIIFVSVFLLIASDISLASWYDTGWITYTQPNGVKFIARMWGDEYEGFFETKEGFSIEKNHSDGYYYYASSSNKGKFIFTQLKVGIDKPIGIPKNLVKTNPFSTRPQNLNSGMNQSDNNRLAKVTVTNYTLKVLLVEFQDVHGDVNGMSYTRSNFKNMLDGSNYTTSPDGETAFGSMNQYYNSMTNSDVVINANVLNNSNGGDLPIWVRLSYNKNDYKNYTRSFFPDAYNAGIAAGYDLSTSSTTKLVYIYAGNYYGDGLNPQAGSSRYMMSEVWSGGYDNEGTVANGYTFAHIGVHCHEFGHTIGLDDIYGYGHGVDWSLMGDGCDMGNTTPHKGQCPAPIDPHQRYSHSWVSVQTPSIPNTGVNLTYDGSNPTIYRIVSGSDVYYFENRRYQDYGRYCPDYGSYSGSGG
ncbi:MAG: metallopeptidase domain-containing protein, partial [Mobilitalea sp.]